ncbi:hypothetical protein diail_8634, partial [Diaporthe ilicicola]
LGELDDARGPLLRAGDRRQLPVCAEEARWPEQYRHVSRPLVDIGRLGDQDVKDLIHSSIASSGDGVTFETVEGQMKCNSDVANNGEINFEWTLRTPGSTN